MPRVFISHSTQDRKFVERELLAPLHAHGVETWCAPEDIEPGNDFENGIKEGLRSCDWFLVVLSPRAIASSWVKREVHWATEHREGRIIQVLLKACNPEELHLGLSLLQNIDYRAGKEEFRQRLLARLDGVPPPPPKPPKPPLRALVIAAAVTGLLFILLVTLYRDRAKDSRRGPDLQVTNSGRPSTQPSPPPVHTLTIEPHRDSQPNKR